MCDDRINRVREKLIQGSEEEELSDKTVTVCSTCHVELCDQFPPPKNQAIEKIRHAPQCPMTAMRVAEGVEHNPAGLKLFLYYDPESYSSGPAIGVFAFNRKQADSKVISYLKCAITEAKVEEREVAEGLMIRADCYYNPSLSFDMD